MISLSSCDKLNSISTNKHNKENLEGGSDLYKIYVHDPANPNANISSLDKLVKKDKDDEIIYVDKNSPKFSTKDCFYPYIKMDKNKPKLFLKIQNVAADPLVINSSIVTVDKVDYPIEGELEKKQINGKKQYFVETLDKEITSESDFRTLEAIANGRYIETILVGENKFIRRNMSKKSIKSFRNVLTAYIYLKNKK